MSKTFNHCTKAIDTERSSKYIEGMNKIAFLLSVAAFPMMLCAQNEFTNKGASVYLQKGALLHVQGNFTNDTGAVAGNIYNDGIIEVKGDFENKSSTTFQKHTDNTSFDRTVKFIGTGTQRIKGVMNNSSNASFYNLVVDKSSSSDTLAIETDINIDGSLIFGVASSASYTPSFTQNTQKGLLKTYTSGAEYLVNITNGDTGAIKGYPSLIMNGSPGTGFVLTKGTRSSSNGGLQRKISVASTYTYPIGTVLNGYNAVTFNFTSIPNSTGSIKGKFNDGTDNGTGYIASLDSQCVSCPGNSSPPSGQGFNRYFATNPCNGPQWLVLEDAIRDHGYWSFASAEDNNNYTYSSEAYPNSFTMEGDIATDVFRLIRHDSARYSYNPTNDVWNSFINQVVNQSDLIVYTKNSGNCFTGNGIPGGRYTRFGHFALSSSKTGGGSLPVELLYISAEALQNQIRVSWATAVEVNNMGFIVERSENGTDWATIGWVDGNNNSTVRIDYYFDDSNVSANQRYYYRLKQVDFDGAFEYTDFVSAIIQPESSIHINGFVPNPSQGITTLKITTADATDINISVYDITGRMIVATEHNLLRGGNQIQLDLRELAAGTYTVIVKGTETFAQKLVIAK